MYFQSRRLTLKVSFQKIGVLTILGQGPDITKSCLNMFPEIPGFLKTLTKLAENAQSPHRG